MNLFQEILQAKNQLNGIVQVTPLTENMNLTDEFEATILLKREDLQVVRSYKIRGAYNKMSSLSDAEKKQGIVCASAGNHAQGVALEALLTSHSQSHCRIHAARYQNHRSLHRPCSSPHNCLCNCIWKRTGRRSAMIHSARSFGLIWV